jgi:hypothetical protein
LEFEGMWAIASWQILLRVLPWTGLFCGIKFGLHRLGFEPWAFDALTGSLFGAATFVVSLVLGGTLGDYRACESLPAQISTALASSGDGNRLAEKVCPDYDGAELDAALRRVAEVLEERLRAGAPLKAVEEALDALNPAIAKLEITVGRGIAYRIQGEQGKIRFYVLQMQGIRDTDFLGPAYVLLLTFLAGAIVTLLLLGADDFSENLTVSAFLFTSFLYLLLLIRDLDNPFEYNGKSSVDVDLKPLSNFSKSNLG